MTAGEIRAHLAARICAYAPQALCGRGKGIRYGAGRGQDRGLHFGWQGLHAARPADAGSAAHGGLRAGLSSPWTRAFAPAGRAHLEENAARLELPLEIFETNVLRVAGNHASEHPCFLCAKMRRGHLYTEAQKRGCNKIALGHHYDDAIETVLMGLIYGGQVQAMLPRVKAKNYAGMELIRPLYLTRGESGAGMGGLLRADIPALRLPGKKRLRATPSAPRSRRSSPRSLRATRRLRRISSMRSRTWIPRSSSAGGMKTGSTASLIVCKAEYKKGETHRAVSPFAFLPIRFFILQHAHRIEHAQHGDAGICEHRQPHGRDAEQAERHDEQF